MPLPLEVRYTKAAAKYLEALDSPTKKRIKERVKAVAQEPDNLRLSYFLTNSTKRSSRIGKYRILMLILDDVLLVSDIASRGQVYRNA
jgi:mRNA-degrading endonuclease RelE of RelBE toxin-antitoxin system